MDEKKEKPRLMTSDQWMERMYDLGFTLENVRVIREPSSKSQDMWDIANGFVCIVGVTIFLFLLAVTVPDIFISDADIIQDCQRVIRKAGAQHE